MANRKSDEPEQHPGERQLKKKLSQEIKTQKRVRIQEEQATKVPRQDKAFYLKQNTITGSKKSLEKKKIRGEVRDMLGKLSQAFELDQVLEEDQELKQQIKRRVVKLHKKEQRQQSGSGVNSNAVSSVNSTITSSVQVSGSAT